MSVPILCENEVYSPEDLTVRKQVMLDGLQLLLFDEQAFGATDSSENWKVAYVLSLEPFLDEDEMYSVEDSAWGGRCTRS